jgi:hypothetical protein
VGCRINRCGIGLRRIDTPHYPLQLLPYCRWHEGQTAELVGACDIVDDTIYRPHHAVNAMPTGLPGLHQGFEAGLQLIHVIYGYSFDLARIPEAMT